MAEDNTAASEETSVAARQLEALSSGLLSAVERFRV
jgi:methyl-accepting chemotaxis protein